MSQTLTRSPFHFDGLQFYKARSLFYPSFKNTEIIVLDARSSSEFDWAEALLKAKSSVENNKIILWTLDFNLLHFPYSLSDETYIASITAALQSFHAIFNQYATSTLGLNLAHFSLDIYSWLKRDPNLVTEEISYSLNNNITARNYLSNFFAHLVPFIPETCIPIVEIDIPQTFSLLDIATLTSCEILQSFCFSFTPVVASIPSLNYQNIPYHTYPVGILLPKKQLFSPHQLTEYTSLVCYLKEKNKPFRFLSENQLTSQWDGLETIFFDKKLTSPWAQRSLEGFSHAGGHSVPITSEKHVFPVDNKYPTS